MNSSRIWLGRHNEEFAKSLPAGSIVLDAGAGSQPYRRLFDHCIYESADFEMVDKEYARSTYVCDLSSIPVAAARFDAVVLNQVLEHLSDPVAVLCEMHRILKNGGTMICSAPLFYEEHEQPYDFFRYTQFAWRHLLRNAGFDIVSLDWSPLETPITWRYSTRVSPDLLFGLGVGDLTTSKLAAPLTETTCVRVRLSCIPEVAFAACNSFWQTKEK